jgi:hypothetical protein
MRAVLLPLAALAIFAAGCGGQTAAVSDNSPSLAARMVCAADAQREISLSLGEILRKPVTPTWAEPAYSCDYVYPAGTVALSVRQLSSTTAAATYYTSARGGSAAISGLGQAAYVDPGGSVTVRKDNLVLRVDVHGLPVDFGRPHCPGKKPGAVSPPTS